MSDIRVRLPLGVVVLLVELADEVNDLQPAEAKAVDDARHAIARAVAGHPANGR